MRNDNNRSRYDKQKKDLSARGFVRPSLRTKSLEEHLRINMLEIIQSLGVIQHQGVILQEVAITSITQP